MGRYHLIAERPTWLGWPWWGARFNASGCDPHTNPVVSLLRSEGVTLLRELEVRLVQRAVVQLHDQLPAGSRPGLVSLPHIAVLIRFCIVG